MEGILTIVLDMSRTLSAFERMAIGATEYGAYSIFKGEICSLLSSSDLYRLRRTSSRMKRLMDEYLKEVINITDFLSLWFDDAIGFRALLAWTEAIATGLPVLQFLDRADIPDDNCLDIVTRVGGLIPILETLDGEGYMRVPKTRPGVYGFNAVDHALIEDVYSITSSEGFHRGPTATGGVIEVIKFVRNGWWPLRHTDGDEHWMRIRVTVVTQPPVEHLILNSPSSMSHNGIGNIRH